MFQSTAKGLNIAATKLLKQLETNWLVSGQVSLIRYLVRDASCPELSGRDQSSASNFFLHFSIRLDETEFAAA